MTAGGGPMTLPEITAAMPAGWVWGIDDRGVYVATCVSRPELRFESTSAVDLEDQVHEALDAWQTELELAGAWSARSRTA